MLPDVNVLIAALRNDHAHHGICRPWLESVVDGGQRFGLSRLVLSAVIRVSTNHRIHPRPTQRATAIGFCQALLDHPNAISIEPTERHWPAFTRLMTEADIVGPRVTDAWFAALAIEHGCEWVTLDRDYARFPGLRWSAPGAA